MTVADLAGAAATERLRGHEEAFALTLAGPQDGAPAGVRAVTHPALGACELFVAPVGEVRGGVQRYEVVVDRSVGAPQDPPAPAPGHEPPPARPGTPEAAAAAVAAETARIERRATVQRTVAKRRSKRAAKKAAARRAKKAAARRRRRRTRRKRVGARTRRR